MIIFSFLNTILNMNAVTSSKPQKEYDPKNFSGLKTFNAASLKMLAGGAGYHGS